MEKMTIDVFDFHLFFLSLSLSSRENKEFYSFWILFKKTLFGSFFGSILMVIVLTQLCATWLYNAYEP